MFNTETQSFVSDQDRIEYHDGFRLFVANVYKQMFIGIAITAIVSFFVSQSPQIMQAIYGTPLQYVMMFAPLAFMLFFSFKLEKMDPNLARMLFYAFAALMGVSISYIFILYSGQDITRAFMVTSITFGITSLYGHTTKRNLLGFGPFLMMIMIGALISSVLNAFVLKSSGFSIVIDLVFLVCIIGLIAYETQYLKNTYYSLAAEGASMTTIRRLAISSALHLYMSFINLFLTILRLFASSRE